MLPDGGRRLPPVHIGRCVASFAAWVRNDASPRRRIRSASEKLPKSPGASTAVKVVGPELVRAQRVAVAIPIAAAYPGDTRAKVESSMIQKVEEPEQ